MHTNYTNFSEVLGKLNDLETGATLLTFGKQLDFLTPKEWHAVGAKVADFRSAIAFQCVSGLAQSVIGDRWNSVSAEILREANRYVNLVKDRPEIKASFCEYRIKNVGHGVAGAVAEMISGGRLGQMGFPVLFCTMFNQNCAEALTHN